MTAPASRTTSPLQPARPPLRLIVVPTPQPPLEDVRQPVRLLLPGTTAPRPRYRPGPRPFTGAGAARFEDDFGPTWSQRSDLPDARDAGRRLITLTLEAMPANSSLPCALLLALAIGCTSSVNPATGRREGTGRRSADQE